MDIEPSSVTYTLTKQEYQRAHRDIFLHHVFRKTWLIILLIFITFNVLLMLMFGTQPIYVFGNIAMAAGLFLLIAGIGFFSWRRSGKTFEVLQGQFEEISWKLSDEALIYERHENHLRHNWNMFREVYVTRHFIILQRIDVAAYLIPLRVFTDGGKAWSDFMRARITKT